MSRDDKGDREAAARLLALRNSTAKPKDAPTVRFTEREALSLVEAVDYVCQNQPYVGYDDNPHQPCRCAGTGADGLPTCDAHESYDCPNRARILLLRKALHDLRMKHGGSPVSERIDGSADAKDSLRVVEGVTESKDIPNPNEPTEKQVKFAAAIMQTLGLGFPVGFDHSRRAYQKLIGDNIEAYRKKRSERKRRGSRADDPTADNDDEAWDFMWAEGYDPVTGCVDD